MNDVRIIKGIVKSYFVGALALSALHTVHSFEKMGLHTGEQYLTPAAIDGIAIVGLLLRGEKWSDDTRKIGMRIQAGAGLAQLASNVYAASSVGGMLLGVIVVGLYVFAEWLTGRMETKAQQDAREALAEAERIAQAEADRAEAERAERNRKARERRASRKAETEALENLLKTPAPRRSRSRAKHAADA